MRVLVTEDDEIPATTIAARPRREVMAVDASLAGAAALEHLSVNRYDLTPAHVRGLTASAASMNTGRKALWTVREFGLPSIVRPCTGCSGTRHHPSGKFRVNANGKLLDVWLLLSCAACGRTSKVPVHQRVHLRSLDRARRLAYETNDPAAVRELSMSGPLAAKHGYRLDWTGAWELQTGRPCYSPDDPAPLKVLISFGLPAPVRVERLLTLGLGLSRAEVRRMAADGRIGLPLALDAKADQDFELTVDGNRG